MSTRHIADVLPAVSSTKCEEAWSWKNGLCTLPCGYKVGCVGAGAGAPGARDECGSAGGRTVRPGAQAAHAGALLVHGYWRYWLPSGRAHDLAGWSRTAHQQALFIIIMIEPAVPMLD